MPASRNQGRLLLIALSALLVCAALLPAQPRHRVFARESRFCIEDLNTSQVREFDMWSTRLANAAFDPRFTDRVIANLDDYLRYGVNTLSVNIQGGNLGSTAYNALHPRVYNANGTLDLKSPVWANLGRLLDETDRRGMVLIIGYWYFKRDENVPTESAALDITRRVTQWLQGSGHRNYILDLVNEFGHPEYQQRSLFSTVTGALQLLDAVYSVQPDVLAGMSPPGRLFAPEGYLDTPSGKKWVEARVIYSHNQPADPRLAAAYYLHGLPGNPTGKPYVNNEFNKQLGYEKCMQKDPRTGYLTFGHWDQQTVDAYVTDLQAIRALGGYANVFSHWQQYLTGESPIPTAEIGPAGTQPEATPGGGEPSMHWAFEAIAQIRKLGPLARRHDFSDLLTGGFQVDLAGRWSVADGELRQTDAGAAPAYTRIAISGRDLEIGFDAAFLAAPGSAGRLGVRVGGASMTAAAYRLLVGPSEITIDQTGGSLPAKVVKIGKRDWDRYCLCVRDGRVSLKVNGVVVADLADATPVVAGNLILFTERATAAFDNLRVGPHTTVTFDNGRTGDWLAGDPEQWSVVTGNPAPNKVWEATASASNIRYAAMDRVLGNFEFRFDVDVSSAVFGALRFRAPRVDAGFGNGYLLRITRTGTVMLDRVDGQNRVTELAYAGTAMRDARAAIRLSVEGRRIRLFVDEKPAIDVVDEGPELAAGALVLVACGGAVRFDDFQLETGPNLFPTTAVNGAAVRRVAADMSLQMSDPDGGLDLRGVRLDVDRGDGHGFIDVTFLLNPWFGVVELKPTADMKGVIARVIPPLQIGPKPWRLRLSATDHDGNVTVAEKVLGE